MSNSINDKLEQLKLSLSGAKIAASILGLLCTNCGKRPSQAYYRPEEGQLCASCLDDILQLTTGCRYGESNCSHQDCQE
jgi:hypothetical protein